MDLSLIAAVAQNNVIGRNGALAWHIPDDLKRFRALTTGHTVIMGRRTHEAIGRALPDRMNIILTRQARYTSPGCLIARSLEEAFALAGSRKSDRKTYIIGGGEIFGLTLELATVLYLTLVHTTVEGDTYFPKLGPLWVEVHREDHLHVLPIPYSFVTYRRRTNNG